MLQNILYQLQHAGSWDYRLIGKMAFEYFALGINGDFGDDLVFGSVGIDDMEYVGGQFHSLNG
jgi:hypothetical protein